MKHFHSIDAIGVTLCVALPAVAYWLAIAPAFRNNAAATALAAELTRQRGAQESVEHSLTAIKSSRAVPTSTPSVTLLPRTELNRRIGELNDLAAARGLQVDSLDPGVAVVKDRYAAIPIALSAEGSYRACEQWLADLHALAPDVGVMNWTIASASTDKQGLVRVTASLQWFCLPAPTQK